MAGEYLGLLDMFDGGGAGQSGDKFEGGIFSGLLNGLGFKPIGHRSGSEASGVDVQRNKMLAQSPVFNRGGGSALGGGGPSAVSPASLQSVALGFGLPSANPLGIGSGNLSIAPQQPQMPDLSALAQQQRQGRAADGLAFALRNPITVTPDKNQGVDQLSAFFQQAVRPGMGPAQRQGTNRHPLAALGFR